MKKLTVIILALIALPMTFWAQTFKFNNEAGNPASFFVTVSSGLASVKGDSLIFHSLQSDVCGPESACQGDLVTSPNPACPGQWVTLTASPTQGTWPYTYLWDNGFTGPQQQLQFWNQSNVWVQVTDATGCSWFADGTIFMNNGGVNPTISGNLAFCSGSSTTLTVSGTGTFSWTGPNGFTASGASIIVTVPGIYTVTVNNGGCSGSASANVTMSQAAIVSITGPAGFCPNSSVSLAASSNVPNTVFSWTGPNGFSANGSSITVSMPGTYTATGTAPGGCSSSATKTIMAFSAPSPKIKVSFVNNIATLSVSAGLNAVWSTGANTPSITNVPNSTYTVTVTDQQTGCVSTSTPVELDLAPCAPPCVLPVASFTFAPSSQNAQVIIFTNTTNTNGVSGTTYAWSFGDGSNSMATSPTHAYQPGGPYTVTLTATNTCGSSTKTQVLTIGSPCNLLLTPTVDNATCNACANGAIWLTVNNGTPPYTYVWSNGATTADVIGLFAGTYTVTVTDNNSCTATASATVGQPPVAPPTIFVFANKWAPCCPQILGTNTVTVCQEANGTIALTAIGGGQDIDNYFWPAYGNHGAVNYISIEDVGSQLIHVQIRNGGVWHDVFFLLNVVTCLSGSSEPRNNDDFRAYPTLTPSQFWLEGAPGMYILTDPQGRSTKLIKTE